MRFARRTGSEISALTEADLPMVLALEQDLFTDPWSERMFRDDLKGDGRSLSLCLRSGRSVTGYLIGWFVADEFHLGNLAVAREEQGKGQGGRLLDHALSLARSRGCRLATLEVRASNGAAIALYRGRGFREVAVRKRYYRDEDALVMLSDLGGGWPC